MTFNEFSREIERALIPVNGERDKIAYVVLGQDVDTKNAFNAVCGTPQELANMLCLRMIENEQFANAVEAAWMTYKMWQENQSQSRN